jgi:hypothetical protein
VLQQILGRILAMVGSNEREKIGYFNFASKVKGGFKMSRF